MFLLSCGGEKGSDSGANGDDETSTVDKVADSVKSAGDTAAEWTRSAGNWMTEKWDSIKSSSAENTEKVKESLDELTDQLNQQIALAQDKATELSGAAKVQMEKGIQGLKSARNEIADAGSRVADATSEQWPAIQKEVAEAWKQAGESMQTIWSAAVDGSDETAKDDSVSSPPAAE